jgi:hypothetical protein
MAEGPASGRFCILLHPYASVAEAGTYENTEPAVNPHRQSKVEIPAKTLAFLTAALISIEPQVASMLTAAHPSWGSHNHFA